MRFAPVLFVASLAVASLTKCGNRCEIVPEGKDADDVPFIHEAFKKCGKDGTVVFTKGTFNINSVMNTTNLENVDVDLEGILKFSTDIPYWRNHSIDVVYQNKTTAWLFGGKNVTMRGKGGYMDGQGQVWYTFNKSKGNMLGRPIMLTVFNSTNVWIDGLRMIQPIFWTTFVYKSHNVSLVNYYANATSNDQYSTTNTDGFNSWNSDTILVQNASIRTDDDCMAVKGNSSNILIKNVTCTNGAGTTIGSVGQYAHWPDYVTNVTFENITCINTGGCAYIKTWQGDYMNSTSNGDGGGGGGGLLKNITFKNYIFRNVSLPIQISQCIYAREGGHGCNTSKVAIEDVHWVDFKGTSRYNVAASLYCSAAHPCPRVTFDKVDIKGVNQTLGLPFWDTPIQEEVFQCANIVDEKKSGIPCNKRAPEYFGQAVRKNIKEL